MFNRIIPSEMMQRTWAAIVVGAGTIAYGVIKDANAKKTAKELGKTRPKREISPLVGENIALTESDLAGGMSEGAKRAYTQQQDKATAGSIGAILRGGGDVNNVADVFASGEEGRQRLALITDQLRLKQIDNVLKARGISIDENDKNFFWNKSKPWQDKAAANAGARKDANATIWSGISTAAGGIANLGESKLTADKATTGTSDNPYSRDVSGFNFSNSGSNSDLGENYNRPSVFSNDNQKPEVQQSADNFQLPDYMNDPNWWTGQLKI